MIYETTIVAHKQIAQGTHELTLKRPKNFVFSPGQYTQIDLSHLSISDHKGSYRLFSIASPLGDLNHLRFVFRESSSGFKQTLIALPLGSKVILDQASGHLLLSEQTRPQVLIAGGVGISAFMGFLAQKDILKNIIKPITLVYGNRDESSAAYLPLLRNLSQQADLFSLVEIYDIPSIETFINIAMSHTNAVWSVVGPPGMVRLTVQGLQQGGVSAQDIKTESFSGY